MRADSVEERATVEASVHVCLSLGIRLALRIFLAMMSFSAEQRGGLAMMRSFTVSNSGLLLLNSDQGRGPFLFSDGAVDDGSAPQHRATSGARAARQQPAWHK
jgi:hypothetical protein